MSPVFISYQHKQNGVVPVHISNITTRTDTLTPHALLLVQSVSVENFISLKDEIDMELINTPKDELSKYNLQKLS